MKVLLLNYEFPPLGGGAATATFNMLKQLQGRKDIEITLLTSSVDEYIEEDWDNIHIIRLNIGKKGEIHNQSNKDLVMYSLKALKWMLMNVKSYDLIHAFFGVPCGFLAMLTGKPYIVSLRGSDVPFYSKKYAMLDKIFFQHLSKIIWNRAEYVVANSEGLRDLAYETYDKKEIGVIYNGVDVETFKPGNKDDGFNVVSTARLIERKGIDYLIKAFAQFAKDKEDVELRLFGGGNQRDELEMLVKDLNIEDKVKFFGEKKREELAVEVPKCQVFALPSKNEGMSNSLLEAMASGLAVIATDVGGTKELVDNSNGVIVEKESVEDIYNALEKLYKDKNMLKKMGEISREKTENMTWGNMADSYLKLYEDIDD
jgi:glycosyltransferase involved in cell wall biosynthesis